MGTGLEVTVRQIADRVVHGRLDVLQGACQDVLTQVALIGIDADAVTARRLRGAQVAESGTARDAKEDVRTLADLRAADAVGRGHIGEAIVVSGENPDARINLLRAGNVA